MTTGTSNMRMLCIGRTFTEAAGKVRYGPFSSPTVRADCDQSLRRALRSAVRAKHAFAAVAPMAALGWQGRNVWVFDQTSRLFKVVRPGPCSRTERRLPYRHLAGYYCRQVSL